MVSDHFLSIKKASYQVKAGGSTLVLIYLIDLDLDIQ